MQINTPQKVNVGLLVFRHTFLPKWWMQVFGAPTVDPVIPALYWRFRRFRRCVGGPGVPALVWRYRRYRRSDGCLGVSGAQLAVPTIQMPRALRPVQLLIRVPSHKAIIKRFYFLNPEQKSRGERMSSLVFIAGKLTKRSCLANSVR